MAARAPAGAPTSLLPVPSPRSGGRIHGPFPFRMPRLSPTILLLSLLAAPRVARGQEVFTDVPRIVAVGDVHGDYKQFVTILRQLGVIDGKSRWTGGRTHLVQTGDVPDRGPDSRKVMELLMVLAEEAKSAGGRVHALVGNHEAMNVLGDLRYVDPGEYAAFRGANSSKLQGRAWSVLSDSTRRTDDAYKAQWYAEHPLGWVEHRLAFEGNGRYATWIRGNNALVKINDYLFVHGGIGPRYVDSTLSAMNAGVRTALSGSTSPPEGNIAEDPEGPLWYRGQATGDEALLVEHVDSVLARFGVKHVVIGHTVTPGTIMPRFGGKVLMIDVGLAAVYGSGLAALDVDAGRAYALHRGTRLAIPLGGDVGPYLAAAAALDPSGTRLRKYVEQLSAAKSP